MKHIPRTWLARVGVAACLATAVTLAALAGAGPAADGAPQSLGRGVDVRDPSTRSLLVAITASVLVMLAGVSLIVAQHRLASGADRREALAALLAARAEPTPPRARRCCTSPRSSPASTTAPPGRSAWPSTRPSSGPPRRGTAAPRCATAPPAAGRADAGASDSQPGQVGRQPQPDVGVAGRREVPPVGGEHLGGVARQRVPRGPAGAAEQQQASAAAPAACRPRVSLPRGAPAAGLRAAGLQAALGLVRAGHPAR